MTDNYLESFIKNAIAEDIGDGDHSSLSCIPPETKGKAQLLIKQNGVSVKGEKVKDFDLIVKTSDFEDGKLLIQKGKKVFHQLVLV